jgi:hypothetical protein
MQSRRGFFQTLLAASASAMLPHVTPKSVSRIPPPGVWRMIPMESTFMTVPRAPTALVFSSTQMWDIVFQSMPGWPEKQVDA